MEERLHLALVLSLNLGLAGIANHLFGDNELFGTNVMSFSEQLVKGSALDAKNNAIKEYEIYVTILY